MYNMQIVSVWSLERIRSSRRARGRESGEGGSMHYVSIIILVHVTILHGESGMGRTGYFIFCTEKNIDIM